MLDPDEFESLDAFRKAQKEEGLKRGWIPSIQPPKILSHSNEILKKGMLFTAKIFNKSERR